MPSRGRSEQVLIGREPQLAMLEQARRKLIERRDSSWLFITGRSGEGKTSLAENFLAPLSFNRDLAILPE